jgi:NAD-dependent dihydropyrimidine dehydrogenase PreA subunit
MSANKTILICQCAERGLLDLALIDQSAGLIVADLCRAAQEKDPVLKTVVDAERPVIYACHPRAVKSLFAFAGCPLPERAEMLNLRRASTPKNDTPSYQSSPAWFPVIDQSRCTNCGQCLAFCLFGVYEKNDAGRIVVAQPGSCKNNCPACARICPETAIIFPKAGESPINGAEVSDELERAANIKINVDEILGNDVYAALNARKQKRRSLLSQKKVEKALAERKRCSDK